MCVRAPLEGAAADCAARCQFKALLLECCLHFGAWVRLQLQSAAVKVLCALRCRSKVFLQSAAVGVLRALWGLGAEKTALQGAAVQVLLSECCGGVWGLGARASAATHLQSAMCFGA